MPTWFTQEHLILTLRTAVFVVVGLVLIRLASVATGRLLGKRVSPQAAMLSRKFITYAGSVLIFLSALHMFGLNITALLGAAGIIGVAVGFASQTSLSNLISGLFLVAEKSFAVGDVLKVGEITGIVDSIDLLSVKIRTFDNQHVRIPNEDMIKARLVNISRFPIRRLDVNVGVDYATDLPRAMKVLEEVADANPFVLDEPRPLIIFQGFGDSSINLTLGVWFAREDVLKVRNSIHVEIKQRFDAEGIRIPFPQITVNPADGRSLTP